MAPMQYRLLRGVLCLHPDTPVALVLSCLREHDPEPSFVGAFHGVTVLWAAGVDSELTAHQSRGKHFD
ncbi:hypothetical protein CesoFtcFv8_025233 [Champsocephalus esox]|uniref:Uncharacterized protein n=1 Tax=Champsocephalus esox TaxID=159716 RepID=A0AAN8B3G6_9TELE|nr:hypothetical protein CesoFtcFv8_025233 [Champsocephalus esox]